MIFKPATLLELFEGHPERWTKKQPARTESGRPCHHTSFNAICFCVSGGARFVYGDQADRIIDRIEAVFETYGFRHRSVILFNDDKDTTFDMILGLVKEAGV